MTTTIAILILTVEKPFNPFFVALEAHMKSEGYEIRYATMDYDSKRGECEYLFRTTNNSSGEIRVTILVSPTRINPKTYMAFKEQRQVRYEPILLGIQSVKYCEISSSSRSTLIAFTENGNFGVSVDPHYGFVNRKFKRLSENNPTENLRRIKKIASVLAPEIERSTAAINWSTVSLSARYPVKK